MSFDLMARIADHEAMSTEAQEATMAPQITIRQATSRDAFALRRLAALDDRPSLRGDVLMAEEAGELRAAISLNNGRVVANPFARTSELVDMLRMHRGRVETVAA
jgi:hypothetical protein